MAQLKPCESREEFMNAWKAGLLVNSKFQQVVPFTYYLEQYTTCNEGSIYAYNRGSVFILVEEDE